MTATTATRIIDDTERRPYLAALEVRAAALAHQWVSQYHLCPTRARKAARLVGARVVVPFPGRGNGMVWSESQPDTHYEIHSGKCNCPDAANRSVVCKHRIALGIERALVPSK